jgi:hypothetical protein
VVRPAGSAVGGYLAQVVGLSAPFSPPEFLKIGYDLAILTTFGAWTWPTRTPRAVVKSGRSGPSP